MLCFQLLIPGSPFFFFYPSARARAGGREDSDCFCFATYKMKGGNGHERNNEHLPCRRVIGLHILLGGLHPGDFLRAMSSEGGCWAKLEGESEKERLKNRYS